MMPLPDDDDDEEERVNKRSGGRIFELQKAFSKVNLVGWSSRHTSSDCRQQSKTSYQSAPRLKAT